MPTVVAGHKDPSLTLRMTSRKSGLKPAALIKALVYAQDDKPKKRLETGGVYKSPCLTLRMTKLSV
ncbi:MAG: hypothetical protein Q4A32_05455 [Lachnospiraceae bacterium]|nr:hypothetical protein [Lachnospiraceae bacterium]